MEGITSALVIFLLIVFLVVLPIIFVECCLRYIDKAGERKRLMRERMEMQEDFIDAYKSMLNTARQAGMQAHQTWNNCHK